MQILEGADRAEFVALGRRRTYKAGETLMLEGDSSDRVMLATAGRVKVVATSEHGDEIVLGMRGEGSFVGEISALDGLPRTATVVALEEVEVTIVSATQYMDFLKSHPDVMLAHLRMLASRLREADSMRLEIALLDTESRVARRLLDLANLHGEPQERGVRITLPISQDELGAWTGASREAVARALRRFRDAGLVETRRREITVLDLEGLDARSRI